MLARGNAASWSGGGSGCEADGGAEFEAAWALVEALWLDESDRC